jgi:hypothetical protein
MTFRKTIAAATSSVALALAAAPALVLTAQTASAQSAETQSAETYSETELDAFVAAFIEVDELRSAYTERLQQAEDEAAQQAIVEEGNAAIATAIEGVDGMTIELYSAILEQAGSDTALNERLTRRLQDAAEG